MGLDLVAAFKANCSTCFFPFNNAQFTDHGTEKRAKFGFEMNMASSSEYSELGDTILPREGINTVKNILGK